MISSNNIKNLLTSLFNKSKAETDAQYNHLETRMNEGWIASGTIENIRGNNFESDILYDERITKTGTYQLSHSINDYDLIGIEHIYTTTDECTQTSWYYTKSIIGRKLFFCHANAAVNNYSEVILNDNSMTVNRYNGEIINKVIGLKNTNINISMYDSTHYSTEEQVIGQWIDGKPLYRKTIIFNSNKQVEADFDISDLNLDDMINIYGSAIIEGEKFIISFPRPWADTGYILDAYIHPDRTKIHVLFGSRYTAKNVVLRCTIEYTKTTDTPFSIDEDIAWVALESDVNDVLNNIGE